MCEIHAAALNDFNIAPSGTEPHQVPTPDPHPRVVPALPPAMIQPLVSGPDDSDGEAGLTKAELITIITRYRGRSNGLEILGRKDLLHLYYHWRVSAIGVDGDDGADVVMKDNPAPPPPQPLMPAPVIGVKREREDAEDFRPGSKEEEPIVID